jgi:hypothetical protein
MRRSTNRFARHGAVLVAALTCLLIVVALLGAMLLAALRTSRQLSVERDLRQCDLLLQAGIDRAILKARIAADYRGETWDLPGEAIVHSTTGRVTIVVAPQEDQSPAQINVTAEYRLGGDTSIRRSRQFAFPSETNAQEE